MFCMLLWVEFEEVIECEYCLCFWLCLLDV